MARATDESETKSKRGKAFHQQQRVNAANGVRSPKARCLPNWLDRDGDEIVVKPEVAAAVNHAYDLYISGFGGPKKIAAE
jgi:hypothetical protein